MSREEYEMLVKLVGHDNFNAGLTWCKGVQTYYLEYFSGVKVLAWYFGHLVEKLEGSKGND